MTALSFANRIKLGAENSSFFARSAFNTARALRALRALSPSLARCILGRRMPTPVELREAFEAMGVTYIKLGQFIGSSPSLFPSEYIEAFQDCFDRMPADDFVLIKAVIERELDRPLESVFLHIDEQPLASASIAQVHSATLKSGEKVVIKVQKPGAEATINLDLNILLLVTRLLERLTPQVNRQMISGFVEAIYPYMMDECDFCKEENYLLEFDRFLKDQGLSNIAVPKPLPSLSTKRVLVMERFFGSTFADYLRNTKSSSTGSGFDDALIIKRKGQAHDFSQAVSNVKSVWMSSLFNNWFFHADLHVGNMMLLDNGQIGLIDFGLVGSIDRKIWQACQKLFIGFSRSDHYMVASALFEIGMTKDSLDLKLFAKHIESLVLKFKEMDRQATNGWNDSGFDEKAFSQDANRWLLELGSVSRNYGLVFPHAFTLMLKQFLYFDRLENYGDSGDTLFDMMENTLRKDNIEMWGSNAKEF